MRIIIFGGGGFLGKKLALELLRRGGIGLNGTKPEKITKLILFDKVIPRDLQSDPRLASLDGDICDVSVIRSLLAEPADVIFHLAAVVSGEAEKNFDLGMQVNLHASLQFLELCRELNQKPVVVFASSCAVFGGALTDTIYDHTAPLPQSSYGTQKAIVELLINDYSRRGFIDGRTLRLPTIAIRPGKPNTATSSFVSGIIREPLQGKRANCPVTPDTKVWILSPARVIDDFILAAELSAESLGTNRIINLPGITTTVKEMTDALEDAAGEETVDLIDWQPDAFIQSIVLTWPPTFAPKRGEALGFKKDDSIRQIIESFIKEELDHTP
jgi:nucleoside-diphosphate-sugar epimerase